MQKTLILHEILKHNLQLKKSEIKTYIHLKNRVKQE